MAKYGLKSTFLNVLYNKRKHFRGREKIKDNKLNTDHLHYVEKALIISPVLYSDYLIKFGCIFTKSSGLT